MSIYGSLLEFGNVGMENYKLPSGKEFSCSKILVSTNYAGITVNVSGYWFSREFGWIASKDVSGRASVVEF